MNEDALDFPAFAALVEDTFDRPPGSVGARTRCDEVPGWDSLGHSTLLARLSRRHAVAITEADAGMTGTVGDFHARIAALPRLVRS